MSNFTFLQPEFPADFQAACQAERRAHADPRAACFYARCALELAMAWLFRHDPALRPPYRDDLVAKVQDAGYAQAAGVVMAIKTPSSTSARPGPKACSAPPRPTAWWPCCAASACAQA